MKFDTITLNFSSDCNMMCKYCDFHDKKYDLKKVNNILREKMQNGDYFQEIIKNLSKYKKNIVRIGLWGLEPSINFDICEKFLKEILDYFTETKEIFYSTNSFLGFKYQKFLLDFLEKYSRSINLSIQFSLDGPKWINDSTRRFGATEKTIKTIQEMIEYSKSLKNVKLSLHLKPTLDCGYMKILAEDDQKFKEYFDFFNFLYDDFKKINKNLEVPCGRPTLVLPHYHTQEDGEIFREFLKKINKYKENYNHNMFSQGVSGIQSFLQKDFYSMMCCAGTNAIAINEYGDLYGCHGLYKLYYDGSNDIAISGQTTLVNKNKEQLIWKQRLLHKYQQTFNSFLDVLILALADCNQIEEKYKYDIGARDLLKRICLSCTCPYGFVITTKNPWIFTTSVIKLYGNGAAEELVKLYMGEKNERN